MTKFLCYVIIELNETIYQGGFNGYHPPSQDHPQGQQGYTAKDEEAQVKRKSDRKIEPVGPISLDKWMKQNPPKKDFQNELKFKLEQKLKEKKNADQKENK